MYLKYSARRLMEGAWARLEPSGAVQRTCRIVGSMAVLVGVAAAIVVVPGGVASASSSGSWTTQASYPAPAGGLRSVSCPGTAGCLAVGSNSIGGAAAYSTTDGGSAWETVAAPLPPAEYNLAAISCISMSSCQAVGEGSMSTGGTTGGAPTGVALFYNGTAWTQETLPSGVGGLSGVSCVSATSCQAVGGAFTSTGGATGGTLSGVALSFNGTAWTQETLPSGISDLTSISCVSATSCQAVGINLSSTGGAPTGVALSYNGTAWTQETLPSGISDLTSISCVSATSCQAGGFGSSGHDVLSWNGTSWATESLPAGILDVTGISCVSATSCQAVGGAFTSSGSSSAAIVYFNGTAWKAETTPSGIGMLFGVSCASATSCEAVGSRFTTNNSPGVALSFDGTAWKADTLPSGVSTLFGVSCASATSCQAVGEAFTATSTTTGVALSFNGTAWTQETLPSGVSTLFGVSCVSATSCQAVGINLSSTGGAPTGVALSYNGTAWTQETLPSGVGGLSGVSCVSATSCQAVGTSSTSTGSTTGVALSFNGTAWTQETLPSGVGGLSSISCVSATSCQAVGTSSTSTGSTTGVALSFNGTAWTQKTLPSGVSDLSGVSCISATSCQAVGQGITSTGGIAGVVLSFNGTAWTQETLPSGVSDLSGVDCASTSACMALGATSADIVILTTIKPIPVIMSITPDSSPLTGGETVTITGIHFTTGAVVTFGSLTLTSAAVTVNSTTSISVVVPRSSAPGTVGVTVTTSIGSSNTAGFVYVNTDLSYVPLRPYRIVDTRCATSPQPGYCSAENLPSGNLRLSSPAAGGSIEVQVTGTGSSGNSIPAGAEAVVVTITAVASPSAHNGYLTAYPAGTLPPTASSLNYAPGEVVPNLVTVTIGTSGKISILSSSSGVNVVVDVEGYYVSSVSSGSMFDPLPTPARILDTRCAAPAPPSFCSSEHIPAANSSTGPLGAGMALSAVVAGVDSVPATATAVSLVVTAASPQKAGYLTVWPKGAAKAVTSNVNFIANFASADSVIVPLGSNGSIEVYNGSGATVNVVVDINGYFASSGDVLTPSSPVRICDTRDVQAIGGTGDVTSGVTGRCANSGTPVSPSAPLTVQVTGVGGVPAGAKVVVTNITVANTSGNGYLTAWPQGGSMPATSNINWRKGEIVPGMVVSTLNPSGQMEVYTSVAANVVVDVVGWYL